MIISRRHILPLLLLSALMLAATDAAAEGGFKAKHALPAAYRWLQVPDSTAAVALPDSVAKAAAPVAALPQDSLSDSTAAILDSNAVLLDSAALAQAAYLDSLAEIFRPLGIWDLDTAVTFFVDSTSQAYFDSLSRFLPDSADIRKAKRRIAKEMRDSARIAAPRILETSAVPDSLYYKRELIWTHDQSFNELKMEKLDTSFNYHFNDYPFLKEDVNATYLGTVGSATQNYNYFKREKLDVFPQFEPYLGYSHTPENLPMYNIKGPYTELAYWGTLFALKKKEESEVKILTTQNITPAFNFTLGFRQYGTKGMLQKETTDNRTFFANANYLGKKYVMHAGYISQKVTRTENGGIKDPFWIRDTLTDAKTIDVNLQNAYNNLKRKTFFITHHLAIPMNFFRKDKDSLDLGTGTMAFIGHSGEYSSYYKAYSDVIGKDDKAARALYFNRFYLNSTNSADSMALRRFENKAFIKLQPFDADAVLSKIDAGVGYQILSYYSFDPSFYITGKKLDTYHNLYLYAGASGMLKKYFAWDAYGKYVLAGYNMFDFDLKGNIRFSVYPIDEGIHLKGHFETSLKEPNPYQKHLYFNHHKWDNDFAKISETRFEGRLEIPKWKLEAFFGYALAGNLLYYDTESMLRQNQNALSIMSAYLRKDLKLWVFHFDNKALFQLSSDQSVMPLPKLSLNLRYYIQFPVVKDVMDMQIGLNGLWNTKYNVQKYSPDLGVFYNQDEEMLGGVPYFDAFVNCQWKEVSVFVKYTNAFMGWPEADYFSAFYYIRPQRGFKFGIFWPFYVH